MSSCSQGIEFYIRACVLPKDLNNFISENKISNAILDVKYGNFAGIQQFYKEHNIQFDNKIKSELILRGDY